MPVDQITWLASYPKSGNTWLRAFLSAMHTRDAGFNLGLLESGNIYSERGIFEALTDLDSRYFYDDEVKQLLPQAYAHFSNLVNSRQYIKVHDGYTFNLLNQPIIPTNGTSSAIYIVRNPLDIAGSLANYLKKPIDWCVDFLNSESATIASHKHNLNIKPQFEQKLLSWSDHVASWTTNMPFPVLLVRYENMLSDPHSSFGKILDFIGIEIDDAKLDSAIQATNFKTLKNNEAEKGFKIKAYADTTFFRSGKAGNWKTELTGEQVQKITSYHSAMMKQLGYL